MGSSSVIHQSAGLTVPGRSVTLPGTIPQTPIGHEWEPAAAMASGGRFVQRSACRQIGE